MSYLVLARKWRPKTFDEVIGQQPVVRTLQNALARNRVAHAMLFSGVRGVGKTTLARIMAKALNCREGLTPTPCNVCDSCRAIAEGNSADLHEIDGASNRGIQEIRELKENIRFFPNRDRFKIVIIDEVHMLTTEAFNALLKTLEEPPAHVYFMFATTELHKIPITILSRCQRYELRRVPGKELAAFFGRIAKEEKVALADRALDLIVREAGGSVRDGLSLLDQVLSFAAPGGEGTEQTVEANDVAEVLGLVDSSVLEKMASNLLAGETGLCLELLDRVHAAGVDLKRLGLDLVSFFRGLLVCKACEEPAKLLDVSEQELTVMCDMAAGQGIETLHRLFQLLMQSIDEMQYSTHPRLVLETALMRGAQSGGVVGVDDILSRLDSLMCSCDTTGQGVAGSAGSAAIDKSDAGRELSRPKTEKKRSEGLSPTRQVKEKGTTESSGVKGKVKSAGPTASAPADSARTAAAASPDGVEEKTARDVRQLWDSFVAYVMDRTPWMAHILRIVVKVGDEDGELILDFNDGSDFRLLQESGNRKTLTEYAQDFFQKELSLRFQVRGAEPGEDQAAGDAKPQEERRLLADDPLVRLTTEIMDGRITNVRTGPRSR